MNDAAGWVSEIGHSVNSADLSGIVGDPGALTGIDDFEAADRLVNSPHVAIVGIVVEVRKGLRARSRGDLTVGGGIDGLLIEDENDIVDVLRYRGGAGDPKVIVHCALYGPIETLGVRLGAEGVDDCDEALENIRTCFTWEVSLCCAMCVKGVEEREISLVSEGKAAYNSSKSNHYSRSHD